MHPIIRLSRPSLIDATNVARLGKTSQPFPNRAFYPNTFVTNSFETFNRSFVLIFFQKRNAMFRLRKIEFEFEFELLLLFIELRKFFGIRETSKNELESKEETRSFFGLIQYFFAIDQIIG